MSLKIARFAAPPLVIAVGAVGAFVNDRNEPVFETDVAPIVEPSVATPNDYDATGFSFGPNDAAPEIVVLDALADEEAAKTKRQAPVRRPDTPRVAPEAAVTPVSTVIASEALSLETEKPTLALEQPNPRRSIRVDSRRDTARGGITTVSDTGTRRGGFRIGIQAGPGCRTDGRTAATTLVFDRGSVGISSVGGSYSRF